MLKNLLKKETFVERFFGNDENTMIEAVENYNHKIKKIEKSCYSGEQDRLGKPIRLEILESHFPIFLKLISRTILKSENFFKTLLNQPKFVKNYLLFSIAPSLTVKP